MGNAVLRSGIKTPARHDAPSTQFAFAMASQAGLAKSFGRATAANPSLAAALQQKEVVESSRQFLAAVKAQRLGETLTGDPAAYLALANTSVGLSERTEETSAELQRTSSSMEQITATVRQTAQTAAGASTIVSANAEVATRGGQIVGNVVTTMDDIRAGEQGRGFAVVASEVRSLAKRTADAAREVKTLIHLSVERVESGAVVVAEAGVTMHDIVANAENIRSLMSDISKASSGQTTGLREVECSIRNLDATTQQNAALVEQTEAAAATLKDTASRLYQEMAYFKLA